MEYSVWFTRYIIIIIIIIIFKKSSSDQLSLRHYSSILNSSLGLPSAQSGRLTRLFGKLACNPFISTHIGRNRPLAVDTMFAVVRKQLRSHPAVSLARPSCGNDDFEERISWIPTICEFLLLTSLAQLVSAASCGLFARLFDRCDFDQG